MRAGHVLLLLVFFFLEGEGRGQETGGEERAAGGSHDIVSSFKPSLALVLGMLSVTFFLTFFLLVYSRFCRGESQRRRRRQDDGGGGGGGVDERLMKVIPSYRFSSLSHGREGCCGMECSVCLSIFEPADVVRLLPKCGHVFHSQCIGRWLETNSDCPLCRQSVVVEDLASFQRV